MPRIARTLSESEIHALTIPGYHAVGHVPGLTLQITRYGTRSWIFRTSVNGRRVELGLGSYPNVSLKEACAKALRHKVSVEGSLPAQPNGERTKPSLDMPIQNTGNMTLDVEGNIFKEMQAVQILQSPNEFDNSRSNLNQNEAELFQAVDPENRESSEVSDESLHDASIIKEKRNPINCTINAAFAVRRTNVRPRTFRDCTEGYISMHMDEILDAERAKNWRRTFARHAFPLIGDIPVSDIGPQDVLQILKPHWDNQQETMHRLYRRITTVLDWASKVGYRERDHIRNFDQVLSTELTPRIRPKTIRAFQGPRPEEMPMFMKKLNERQGFGAETLKFMILTMCKSGQARKAYWDHVNLESGFWKVRAPVGPTGPRYRHIPLSVDAVELLKSVPRLPNAEFIFSCGDRPISDGTLLAVLRRMNVKVVPEGFRKTFAEWCFIEKRCTPRLCNIVLGTDSQYTQKPDIPNPGLYQEWRQLLQDWASFIGSEIKSQ